jgi:hypothetical protein
MMGLVVEDNWVMAGRTFMVMSCGKPILRKPLPSRDSTQKGFIRQSG